MNTALIKPEWSPITIGLMVLGFIIFWPLGLAMLAYILWGEKFGGSAERAEAWVKDKKHWAKNCRHERRGSRHSSGNAAFDDYRAEQMKRLEEERKRLDEEVNAFHEYMRNLNMARDREEFDRFMRDRKDPRDGNDNRPDHGHDYSGDRT